MKRTKGTIITFVCSFINMRLLIGLCLVACSAAAGLHYASPLLVSTSQEQAKSSTRQYHTQDTQGFYSYGYSDDSSAKAEYKSLDGSAKGFYAYVDADGKLQTVEYVAGRQEGFKAAATNLPEAPVEHRRAPVPVKDTPEVQMAKKEHFEAYREAELRAALASGEQQSVADADADADAETDVETDVGTDVEVDADADTSNSRDNMIEAEMSSSSRNRLQNGLDNAINGKDVANQSDPELATQIGGDLAALRSDISDSRLMTTYTFGGQLATGIDLSNGAISSHSLPAMYTNVGGLVRLNDLTTGGRRTFTYAPAATSAYPLLRPAADLGTVQLPMPSYYTVLTPTSNYRIATVAPIVANTPPSRETTGDVTTLTNSASQPSIHLRTNYLSHRLDANK